MHWIQSTIDVWKGILFTWQFESGCTSSPHKDMVDAVNERFKATRFRRDAGDTSETQMSIAWEHRASSETVCMVLEVVTQESCAALAVALTLDMVSSKTGSVEVGKLRGRS